MSWWTTIAISVPLGVVWGLAFCVWAGKGKHRG